MINLCFVTDDGYSMPTGVTIYSIYKNRDKKNKYTSYILCKNVSDENKKKLSELSCDDFKIVLVDCDNEDFSDLYIPGIPATPTSVYKFFIPSVLSNLDRVLYLDGDIIVTSDLKELYEIDIKDNYIGAVKDTNGLDRKKYINDNYSYINSGVLVMNLKKMREDNMPDRLIEYRKNGYNKLMDQDTFNYVLRDKIEILPFKYNTQMNTISTAFLGHSTYNLKNFITYWNIKEETTKLEDIYKQALVLHYTTAKPWKYYDGYGNDLWLTYYINSPYGKKQINRDSYYIKRIVSTKAYNLGYFLTLPKKKFKQIFKSKKNKKYEKFLDKFNF